MELAYEQKYHELEANHWWFKTRREAVLRFVQGYDQSRILDVGCASGHLLTDLESMGFVKSQLFGIDVSEPAISEAQASGFKQTWVMDGSNLTFKDDYFDILIASDSLEHMEYDQQALEHWWRVLKPGGTLIVFVPAFMSLWSAHDEVNHHFRRYTKRSLSTGVMKAGFTIKKSGYWNSTLFPAIAFVRIIKRWLSTGKAATELEDDLSLPRPVINNVLTRLLRWENTQLHASWFPFGVSTFCIAQKDL
ncbi:MAG: class I SAM-dependent methyltransferase [Bacteroidota bacterium]